VELLVEAVLPPQLMVRRVRTFESFAPLRQLVWQVLPVRILLVQRVALELTSAMRQKIWQLLNGRRSRPIFHPQKTYPPCTFRRYPQQAIRCREIPRRAGRT